MLDRRGPDIAVWLLLLALPYWLNWVGGYTSLGSRVLVLGLAAMSLNFLLGFTGVLSFGHAAYFGLGVYGVGLTIKYLVPSTLVGMAVGVIAGAIAAALIGLLIVRLRGIYFAMVTIAFGQSFTSLPIAGTPSPAAMTGSPAGTACRSMWVLPPSTSSATTRPSIILFWSLSPWRSQSWR